MFRPINPTGNAQFSYPIEITDCIVDNRALKYRAAVFGKTNTSSETLAETIVSLDMVVAVGEALVNPMYQHRALEVIFPKDDAKLSEGVGMFVFPMLVDAFRISFNKVGPVGSASTTPADASSVTALSHVFADLTAQALAKRNMMLPTEGHIALLTAKDIFPTEETINKAILVKQLTDVLDTIQLDPAMGRVKTTTVAALRAVMGPAMAAAGRRILNLATMAQSFEDTVTIVGMFLKRAPGLPQRLLADPNLVSLAANMTIVKLALEQGVSERTIYNPEYSYAEILGEVSRLIRDNPRFSVKSLREIQEYYSHVVVRDNAHRVSGLVIGRNIAFNYKAQATIFTMIGSAQAPLWNQSPVPGVEAVIDGYVAPLNGLTTSQTLNSIANIAALTGRDGVALAYGMTEDELLYYAAATAETVVLANPDNGDGPMFMFLNTDSNEPMCYKTQSIFFGDTIMSQDPAEAIIHSPVKEHMGNKHWEATSQAIPTEFRKSTFFTNPNEIASTLSDEIEASIVLADDSIITTTIMTDRLMRLTGKTNVRLTISPMNAAFLDGYITTLMDLLATIPADTADHVRNAAVIQAAMAINSVLARVYQTASAKAFAASISRFFLNQAATNALDPDVVRGQLNRGLTSVQLQMLSATILLKLFGLLTVSPTEILGLMEESKLNQYLIGATDTHLALL